MHGHGFTMSTALTTANIARSAAIGIPRTGSPIKEIGRSIHSSATIRPSSFMPNLSSASVHTGTEAAARRSAAGIWRKTGRSETAKTSATPGSEPNVPGANGA